MIFYRWIMMAALLLLMTAGNGWSGEFYQYTDQNGNLIFTDDMSRVPEDQQQGVEIHTAIEYDPGIQPEPDEEFDEEATDSDEVTEEGDENFEEEMEADIPDEAGIEPEENPEEGEYIDFDQEDYNDVMSSENPEKEIENPANNESVSNIKEEHGAYAQFSSEKLDQRKAELDKEMNALREEKKILNNTLPETMNGDQLTAYDKQDQDLSARIREHKAELTRFRRDVASFNNRIKRRQLKEREKQKRADEEMGIY